MPVEEGDWVLLYIDERRNYLVRAIRGREMHTDEGVIDLGSLVGLEYGERVRTHLGVEVLVTRPSLVDIVVRGFRRCTQIIYPKDAAYIALHAGVGPGATVVEAGTGTGALTAIIASLVKPDGKVYTYEVRKDFLEVARRNLKRAGLADYVVFKHKDVREGIEEEGVDAVILDMPDPWRVAQHAFTSLRSGGSIVCFVPTFNQMERTATALREEGFIRIEAVEILERRFKVVPGETRPLSMMIGHTGFIIIAKRP